MTRLYPCHGCPLRNGCEKRDEFRQRANGVGAVTIKFRCNKLLDEMRPGRRISIETPRIVASPYCDDETVRSGSYVVSATITTRTGYKFTCVVDPGQPGTEIEPERPLIRFRKTMGHHRIKAFKAEPDATLCEFERVQRDGVCDSPKPTESQQSGGCYCNVEQL